MGAIKSGMPQRKQVLLSDLDRELDLLKLKVTEPVNKIEHPERALVSEFVPAKKAAKLIGIWCTTPQKYTEESLYHRYRLGTKIYHGSTNAHMHSSLIEAINFRRFHIE